MPASNKANNIAANRIAELEKQLAQARKDSERLDWLESKAKGGVFDWIKVYTPATIIGANAKAKGAYPDVRTAIDAAMKEATCK